MSSLVEPLAASNSASAIVQQLAELDTSSSKFTELLKSILLPRKYAEFRAALKADEALAQSFIDMLDLALETMSPDSEFYHKSLRALRKICGETRLLPTSLMLSKGLEKIGETAVASGGFADVWKGDYQGRQVAIKALRVYKDEDIKRVKKLYCKEVVVWKRLSHENVVPFLGVSSTIFKLSMISDWMPNGTISEYLKAHDDANRLALLLNAANGLQFLHKANVVHGDLKGANILINGAGIACLADFGLASITSDPLSMNASTARTHGSFRWMAPELLNPDYLEEDENGPTAADNLDYPPPQDTGLDFTTKATNAHRPTQQSDVYALAMVIIEVTSGYVPFHTLRDEHVIFKILSDSRPKRPQHPDMSDDIWEMVQISWSKEPVKRSKLEEVIRCLERAANPASQSPQDTSSLSMASTRVVSAEEKELNEKTELRPSFIQRLIQKCGCLTEVESS